MHRSNLNQRPDEIRIAEEAARWMDTLADGNEQRAAFFDWLQASPRHVEELLLVMAATAPLAQLDPERRREMEEALETTPGAPMNVVPFTPSVVERITHPPRKVLRLAVGIAVLGLVLALGWWHFANNPLRSQQTFTTAIGEQRTVSLADGSVVQLNTDSHLAVKYSSTERDLRLLEGEALFNVERDPARPFRVHVGDTVVQALGTEFNVYRRAAETRVAVLKGAVRISEKALSTQLLAGEEANIAVGGTQIKREPLDAMKATAWRQRRLVFRNDTLAEIAGEFNRYNRALQISVEPEVAGRHFAGTFNADAPESLAQALRTDPSLEIERGPNRIIIRSRDTLR